jgi:succinyl-diaminopimelate desuccinylase
MSSRRGHGLAVEALVGTIVGLAGEEQVMMSDTIDANFSREVAFLKALVRVASDNPPGDCAPPPRSPQPLSGAGLHRRAPSGTGGVVRAERHDQRHQPDRSQDLRAPAGTGRRPQRPRRRRAAGRRLDGRSLRRRREATARSTAAARRCRSRISPPMPSPSWRWKNSGARRDGIELHFTYDEEAGGMIGPKWLIENG